GADEVAAFDEAAGGQEVADLAARAGAGDGGDERQAGQGGEIFRRHEGNALDPLTEAARVEFDDGGWTSSLGPQRLPQAAAGLAVTPEDVTRFAAQEIGGENRGFARGEALELVGVAGARQPLGRVAPEEQPSRYDAEPAAAAEQSQKQIVVLRPGR